MKNEIKIITFSWSSKFKIQLLNFCVGKSVGVRPGIQPNHGQKSGLGDHFEIRRDNPIQFSNQWQKEFFQKLSISTVIQKIGIFRNIEKVSVKNTTDESGKCKTTIEIDESIVFISDEYTWMLPDNFGEDFEVRIGSENGQAKATVKNIEIISFE